MKLEDFLRLVLPAQGDYFTAHLTPNGTLKQKKWTSIEEVQTAIQRGATAQQDFYYATGTYDGARKIDCCTAKRAWYVDIDCGEGKQYETKRDAILAIKDARQGGLLAPSLIVDSGNGYHLYWVLDQDIETAQWSLYAEGIAQMCGSTGLNIDQGITTDAARILRAPTTPNNKDPQAPKACSIVSKHSTQYTLDAIRTALKPHLTPQLAVSNPDLNDDLSSGLQDSPGTPPPAAGMLDGCPFFANQLANQGTGTPGVLWHKVIHTLAYTEDGEDYIHEISKGHDDYTPHGTRRRWEYAQEQKEKLGATLCQTFEANGASECKDCPLRGKGKSPVSLAYKARRDAEEEAAGPEFLPFPFRNHNGAVQHFFEERWEPYLPSKLSHIVVSAEKGSECVVSFVYQDKVVQIDHKHIVDHKQFRIALGTFGVGASLGICKRMDEVITSFMDHLSKNKKTSSYIVKSFGWHDDVFHAGGEVYGPSCDDYQVMIDAATERAYTPKGDYGGWAQVATVLTGQHRPAAWTILASAFAAPLMTFTGVTGAVLSIHSPTSGTGKTTALKAAQAVWGSPSLGLAHLTDTANSVSLRLGTLNNLPLYWDELRGSEHMGQFTQLLFRLSQGKDKQRLTADIRQRSTGSWETMLVVGTNESIREHIAPYASNTDAGSVRIFEIDAEDLSPQDKQAAAKVLRSLPRNYGWAGQIYGKYLAENKEGIKRLLAKAEEVFAEKTKSEPQERFWLATISTLFVGASIANKLKLTGFNLPALRDYLIAQYLHQRQETQERFQTGGNLAVKTLQEYIIAMTDYTIIADNLPAKGKKGIISIDAQRRPVCIRVAYPENQIRLEKGPFERWILREKGVGGAHIMRELKRMGAAERMVSLDAGSPLATGGRRWCLDIPLQGDLEVLRRDDS